MPTDPQATPHASCNDARCLGYADQLLIWSFRACATNRWPCAMLEREFKDACGPAAAADARGAVRTFARALETQTRRSIVLSPPGRTEITDDEQRLLAVYAAAQADDRAGCEAHLSWLLAGPPSRHFFALAQVTATALLAEGHRVGAAPLEAVAFRGRGAQAQGLAA